MNLLRLSGPAAAGPHLPSTPLFQANLGLFMYFFFA